MADIFLINKYGEPQVYSGISCVKFKNSDGGVSEFYSRKNNYVVGTPINITIPVSEWSGTKYTFEVSEFGPIENLQIGIPVESSIENAQIIMECALTIPYWRNSYLDKDDDGIAETYSCSTISISALKTPTKDIAVCIWGLANE